MDSKSGIHLQHKKEFEQQYFIEHFPSQHLKNFL
jgi:hypothetical protein